MGKGRENIFQPSSGTRSDELGLSCKSDQNGISFWLSEMMEFGNAGQNLASISVCSADNMCQNTPYNRRDGIDKSLVALHYTVRFG